MGHNVGKAADNAVQKGAYKKTAERAPEQILKDIRNHLDAKLAITSDDVRFLLAAYDEKNVEIVRALVLLNEHLTGRVYDSLDDALRNLLQAYITMNGNQEEVNVSAGS